MFFLFVFLFHDSTLIICSRLIYDFFCYIGLVNYNTLSHPTRGPNIEALMKTRKPLATEAWDYSDSDATTVGKCLSLDVIPISQLGDFPHLIVLLLDYCR